MGIQPEDWVVAESENLYASDGRSVDILDATIRAMDDQTQERIIYDAHNEMSRDLANWWERRLAVESAREQRENEAQETERLRTQARSKLTPEEREALEQG